MIQLRHHCPIIPLFAALQPYIDVRIGSPHPLAWRGGDYLTELRATDRLEELVRARGRIRRSEAAAILGMSERTIGSAVGNLRLRGRLLGVGKGRTGVYLEAAG